MRNVWTICQKELKSYFASPIAYLAMAMFAIIFGFFFWNVVAYFVNMSLQSQMMGRSFPMDVNEMVIRPLLMNTSVIGLFLIPMIAMRLFSEEKRSMTIELLLTSPLYDAEIVIGKWLAAVGLYAVLLLISALDMAFLFAYGQPDWKPLLAGYLGLLLWVFEWVGGYETAAWAKVMAYMSVITHFEPFAKGVIDSKDAVYFLSLIFLGLFLSVRSLESLRWRS